MTDELLPWAEKMQKASDDFKAVFADETSLKEAMIDDLTTEGTAGSVAAHGFINLRPKLIAALTGSDGGDLDWLGNAGGTRDFMHFQLKAGDRPALQ